MANVCRKYFFGVFLVLLILLMSSCTRRLGYGVLLWSAEDPDIPSGTVLPIYIRSNIDRVWVAGIPDEYREKGSNVDKFEIPLAKLELSGNKKKALARAEEFAPYALSYAETLQDGLPIREFPENGSRRVYRLKIGEIIKIIVPVTGVVAVGATGDPLPGEWFRVLTEDGTLGYCFSYRLRIFEHTVGRLVAMGNVEDTEEDPELERLLSRTWSAEDYGTMVNNQRIDLKDLGQNWVFDPGLDTGIARIKNRDVDRSFIYTAIRTTGTKSWRFDGSSLQISLRSDTVLAVQYTEDNGLLRTFLFVALPTSVDDLIIQELARRDALFDNIFSQGPIFTSNNYGTIIFTEEGRFTWSGNELLIPSVIPVSALGSGVVDMRLFLAPSLSDRYDGAFTMRFNRLGGGESEVNFMYTLDNQGFRLEHVPYTSLDETVVSRRAASPLVLYFFRSATQVFTPQDYYPQTDYGTYPPAQEWDFADDNVD